MQITPHIHQIPGVEANSYLLVDSDGLTLIDTGIPGSHKKILKHLAELGHAPTDIKHILITHADMDHIGGLAALKADCGARLYANKLEAEAIASGQASRPIVPKNVFFRLIFGLANRLMKATPATIDEHLEDGQTLPMLGGLRVLGTPGHTPGHLSFFAESEGVLFSGDSVIANKGGLQNSRPPVTWDKDQARVSAHKQANLKPRVVCPGHGPVVTEAENKFPGE
jgi:glyoxylase-like metal-dependent hydrolase (beta-lactamase superfamily II)